MSRKSDQTHRYPHVNYKLVSAAALPRLNGLLSRWLPSGRRIGAEWVACNPIRNDHAPGSFKINIRTGRWADFATGDKGGDVVSLLAYLRGTSQSEAARLLARELEVQP
jgi:hypothetical protein